MSAKKPDRRRFLKDGAALAGLAMGGAVGSSPSQAQTPASETPEVGPTKDVRAYGERSRFETSRRIALMNPLQDSVGIITPSALHGVASHGYETPPDIDPAEHRLMVHGLVDRPLIFTMEELKRLPAVTRVHFIECGGNSSPVYFKNPVTAQMAHGLTGCSEWTGVPLSLLLKMAGVKKGASWLLAEGADQPKHSMSVPLTKAMDDALVAYGQNGEAIRPEQGYPVRLLLPGWQGVRNVKWLRRIEVGDKPWMTLHETSGYVRLRPDGTARWFQFELPPKSVITRPSGGQQLSARGYYQISGLAWSGGGAIRRVEVSVDGGETWEDAQIQGPIHSMAHTRFGLDWNWDGQETVLLSRCTDERGQVQPSLAELGKIWGVGPDYWRTTTAPGNNFNAIQPWRVAKDGSVHNALWES